MNRLQLFQSFQWFLFLLTQCPNTSFSELPCYFAKRENLFSIYVNSEKRREQEDYSIQPKKNRVLVHISKCLAVTQPPANVGGPGWRLWSDLGIRSILLTFLHWVTGENDPLNGQEGRAWSTSHLTPPLSLSLQVLESPWNLAAKD